MKESDLKKYVDEYSRKKRGEHRTKLWTGQIRKNMLY